MYPVFTYIMLLNQCFMKKHRNKTGMNEPETLTATAPKGLEEMERMMAAAFRAKGRELTAMGTMRGEHDNPAAVEFDADLMAKAVFHGQLHALLAGAAAGRTARGHAAHGPN